MEIISIKWGIRVGVRRLIEKVHCKFTFCFLEPLPYLEFDELKKPNSCGNELGGVDVDAGKGGGCSTFGQEKDEYLRLFGIKRFLIC